MSLVMQAPAGQSALQDIRRVRPRSQRHHSATVTAAAAAAAAFVAALWQVSCAPSTAFAAQGLAASPSRARARLLGAHRPLARRWWRHPAVELHAASDARAVLGVGEDASPEEVRQAYRERVRKAHPDAGGSEEEFLELQSAYQLVRSGRPAESGEDPAQRKERRRKKKREDKQARGNMAFGQLAVPVFLFLCINWWLTQQV
mmetsp:Transcript_81606/g.251897  ORF Transcript_81606/g.251897 Transcript_81606/m.251897 type:complete len:202 (-) Transcript_81606:83-688(-)